MDYLLCNRKNCINWKKGRCSLKDPEKEGESRLHYEDTLDSLRLKQTQQKEPSDKHINCTD